MALLEAIETGRLCGDGAILGPPQERGTPADGCLEEPFLPSPETSGEIPADSVGGGA